MPQDCPWSRKEIHKIYNDKLESALERGITISMLETNLNYNRTF